MNDHDISDETECNGTGPAVRIYATSMSMCMYE